MFDFANFFSRTVNEELKQIKLEIYNQCFFTCQSNLIIESFNSQYLYIFPYSILMFKIININTHSCIPLFYLYQNSEMYKSQI